MTTEVEGKQDEALRLRGLAQEAGTLFVRARERFAPMKAVGLIVRNEPSQQRPWVEFHIDLQDGSHRRYASSCQGREEGLHEVHEQAMGVRSDQGVWMPDPVAAFNDIMEELLDDAQFLTGKDDPEFELLLRFVPSWQDKSYHTKLVVRDPLDQYRFQQAANLVASTFGHSVMLSVVGAMQDVKTYCERRRHLLQQVA